MQHNFFRQIHSGEIRMAKGFPHIKQNLQYIKSDKKDRSQSDLHAIDMGFFVYFIKHLISVVYTRLQTWCIYHRTFYKKNNTDSFLKLFRLVCGVTEKMDRTFPGGKLKKELHLIRPRGT